MAAWGSILSQLGGAAFGGTAGALINFGGNLINSLESDKAAKKAKNSYYAALAEQRQLAQVATQVAQQRAQFEEAMKTRILSQTDTMGNTMRAAQTAMGAMPQFDQGRIDQDYATTKSTMMNDFNDMLKLVESQGRTSQIERLGGAGSYAADTSRMSALTKRFAPELQKLDSAAYDAALSRASNTQNLISKNRSDTLKEIEGLYDPQIQRETALLTGGGTDISNLINSNNGYLNQIGTTATGEGAVSSSRDKDLSASLGVLLSQVFNKTR